MGDYDRIILIMAEHGQWKQLAHSQKQRGNFSRVRKGFFNENLFDYDALEMGPAWQQSLLKGFCNTSIVLAVLVVMFYFLPEAVTNFFPQITQHLIKAEQVAAEPKEEEIILAQLPDQKESTTETLEKTLKPKYDLNFPAGQWLEINSVGIKTEILTNDAVDEKKEVKKLLEKGVYVYPGYTDYGDPDQTVIIAGHHYNMWTSVKQNEESFQKLDKVNVGDLVTITDNQKQWTYRVYKVEKGENITDEADLVMYTCVFWWDSKLRLFVYAELVTE